MLKNDMRKMMLEGATFEEFCEKYGEQYIGGFTVKTMKACWKNTKKLLDPDEWHRYLKNSAYNYVRYLTMIEEAMEEEGIELGTTRAGYMLKDLIRKQVYKPVTDYGMS